MKTRTALGIGLVLAGVSIALNCLIRRSKRQIEQIRRTRQQEMQELEERINALNGSDAWKPPKPSSLPN